MSLPQYYLIFTLLSPQHQITSDNRFLYRFFLIPSSLAEMVAVYNAAVSIHITIRFFSFAFCGRDTQDVHEIVQLCFVHRLGSLRVLIGCAFLVKGDGCCLTGSDGCGQRDGSLDAHWDAHRVCHGRMHCPAAQGISQTGPVVYHVLALASSTYFPPLGAALLGGLVLFPVDWKTCLDGCKIFVIHYCNHLTF